MHRRNLLTGGLAALLTSCSHRHPKRHSKLQTLKRLSLQNSSKASNINRERQVLQALENLDINNNEVRKEFPFRGRTIEFKVQLDLYKRGVQVETSKEAKNHEALFFSRLSEQRPYITALARHIAPQNTSERYRITAILEFVSKNIQRQEDWENSYVLHRTEEYHGELFKTPLQTLYEGGGDCDDYATLSKEMLVSVGIEAKHVRMKPRTKDITSNHRVIGVPFNNKTFPNKANNLKNQFTYVTLDNQDYVLLESQRSFNYRKGFSSKNRYPHQIHDEKKWVTIEKIN